MLLASAPARVGYVLKRYPRFSETFIVSEILAHEAAGLPIEIFALGPSFDGHFQDAIARVRAPVTYLTATSVKATDFWRAFEQAKEVLPNLGTSLDAARGEAAQEVYQALELARQVRLKGLTHLHAHFATSATTVARLGAQLTGVPFSFTAHAKDIFHESVRSDDLLRKLSEASATVTVSEYNLAHLRAVYGRAASQVQRIYNGLDLDEFPYREPGQRPPSIVAVGRLIEKKGFADLIDACALLAARGRDLTCAIVGSGELEADLRAQIERRGLQSHVELVGPLPRSEVLQCVRDAAVFAAPCVVGSDGNRDGLPTVLLEAMAVGTPCISTDVTGIPEVIRDGETGLMVPQHDPPALAAAIERLFDDGLLRARLARQARRLIEANFNIHRNAASLRALFTAGQRIGAAARSGA